MGTFPQGCAVQIEPASSASHVASVRKLFLEYAEALGISLCFQNFEEELASLPGKYAPPRGQLLIAHDSGQAVGCVGLREIDGPICEMKRLYVRPGWRKQGVGRVLAEAIVTAASEIGYERMRLDTLEILAPAIALYQSMGFRKIPAYYDNPNDGVVFMELDLAKLAAGQPRTLPRALHSREVMRGSRPLIPVSNTARVPARWNRDVERILITRSEIERRLRVMAREIQKDFNKTEMVVVSLLNGTVMFLADLVRHLSLPLRLDFIGVSSYRTNTESGELVFTKDLRLDVRGRDVLLVDDILDTGKTITRVQEKLRALDPKQIRICVLLDKPSRRQYPVQAHYVGFEIPDVFVVGYGLDFAERYRNLPFVGVLHPQIYSQINTASPPLSGACSTNSVTGTAQVSPS